MSANSWTRWFAAGAPDRGWRLLRFEQVDDAGKPVGKPIEALTPALRPRRFPNERQAEWAASALNREEGR